MSTDKVFGRLVEEIKNVFSILNSFFSSKYFLIPAFGLDFALRGGTKSVIPMLSSMGITISAPLFAELAFALLAGGGIYYAYKVAMDYIIAPIMNICVRWFNSNIYQPCCNFANNMIFNSTELHTPDKKSKCGQGVKSSILEDDSSAVFLPLASKGTIGGIPVVRKQDQQEQKKSSKLSCKS